MNYCKCYAFNVSCIFLLTFSQLHEKCVLKIKNKKTESYVLCHSFAIKRNAVCYRDRN